MKKNLLIIELIVAIIIISLTLYNLNRDNKLNDLEISNKDLKYYFKQCINYSIQNNNISIEDTKIYIGHNDKEAFNLYDSISVPKLIYRFYGDYCSLCIDFGIKEVKDVFHDFKDNNNIWLLGSNINPRLKSYYFGKKIYSYYDDTIRIPFEKTGAPFFYVLDSDRKTKFFFIPDKSKPYFTKTYLLQVKKYIIK